MPIWCSEDGHEIFRGSESEMATALDEARKEIERLRGDVKYLRARNNSADDQFHAIAKFLGGDATNVVDSGCERTIAGYVQQEVKRLRADNDRLYAAVREILASPPAGVSNAVVSEVERLP